MKACKGLWGAQGRLDVVHYYFYYRTSPLARDGRWRPSWHGDAHPSSLRQRRDAGQLTLRIPDGATNVQDGSTATYVGPVRLGILPFETTQASSSPKGSPFKSPLMQAVAQQGKGGGAAAPPPQRQRAMVSVS